MQSFGGDRMGGLLSELGPTGPETPEGDVTILAGPAATVPSANWCAVCSAGVHGGIAVHGRRRHNRAGDPPFMGSDVPGPHRSRAGRSSHHGQGPRGTTWYDPGLCKSLHVLLGCIDCSAIITQALYRLPTRNILITCLSNGVARTDLWTRRGRG